MIDDLPVELHLPDYHYCGPGIKLKENLANNVQPINKLDAHCKEHHILYANSSDSTVRSQADLKLADQAWERVNAPDSTFGETIMAYAIVNAMKMKANSTPVIEISSKASWEQSMISKALKTFETVSCVRFIPHKKEKDYVYFVLTKETCASPLGRLAIGAQPIFMTPKCLHLSFYKGSVVHEIMHTLGFIHEHQRYDRDCYVSVTGVGKNLKDVIKGPIDTRWPYDLNSIMHYKEKDYMRSKNGKLLGNTAGTLTKMDQAKLNYLYCGTPHYCDLHAQECNKTAEAEKKCSVNP